MVILAVSNAESNEVPQAFRMVSDGCVGYYVNPISEDGDSAHYSSRSIPPGNIRDGAYHLYNVTSSVSVTNGTTAPAFGQPGGGVQYKFDDTLSNLEDQGYIQELQLDAYPANVQLPGTAEGC